MFSAKTGSRLSKKSTNRAVDGEKLSYANALQWACQAG
jgi:hypothetical protein